MPNPISNAQLQEKIQPILERRIFVTNSIEGDIGLKPDSLRNRSRDRIATVIERHIIAEQRKLLAEKKSLQQLQDDINFKVGQIKLLMPRIKNPSSQEDQSKALTDLAVVIGRAAVMSSLEPLTAETWANVWRRDRSQTLEIATEQFSALDKQFEALDDKKKDALRCVDQFDAKHGFETLFSLYDYSFYVDENLSKFSIEDLDFEYNFFNKKIILLEDNNKAKNILLKEKIEIHEQAFNNLAANQELKIRIQSEIQAALLQKRDTTQLHRHLAKVQSDIDAADSGSILHEQALIEDQKEKIKQLKDKLAKVSAEIARKRELEPNPPPAANPPIPTVPAQDLPDLSNMTLDNLNGLLEINRGEREILELDLTNPILNAAERYNRQYRISSLLIAIAAINDEIRDREQNNSFDT